jgi:hypothetical protein
MTYAMEPVLCILAVSDALPVSRIKRVCLYEAFFFVFEAPLLSRRCYLGSPYCSLLSHAHQAIPRSGPWRSMGRAGRRSKAVGSVQYKVTD